MSGASGKLPVVLVTGLSGAGKSSILRTLEDLGFEAIDNPPLSALEDMVARSDRKLAIGVDARSRGFAADAVVDVLERLRLNPNLQPALVFATADEAHLLRRYSETRRRHPLAQSGKVADGIALEQDLTAKLARAADLLVDTSTLSLASLRQIIEQRFGGDAVGLNLSLVSFGYPGGLPPDADLVFDARFLRNPHYDPALRNLTGLDAEVQSFIEHDPDFTAYFKLVQQMVDFLLPRFVQEGKKYATIAVGCTGGQHRSVYMIEKLASYLSEAGWRAGVTHRESAKFLPSRQHQITSNK